LTAGSAAAKVISSKFLDQLMCFVQYVSGIRKIKAQVVTKMDNSIKKGKLIVIKNILVQSKYGNGGY